MDTKLIFLTLAACMCGSLKRSLNLPLLANLAHALNEYREPLNIKPPYYTQTYEGIFSDAAVKTANKAAHDTGIEKLNYKSDFSKIKINGNADLLILAQRFQEKTDAAGTPITTIPAATCDVFSPNYNELKIAKMACALDHDCIAVVDDGCDQRSPFQLCRKKALRKDANNSRCLDAMVNQQKNENFQKKLPFDRKSSMAVLSDDTFRFSTSLHTLDWKKIAKSEMPFLNDERIDYVLSLAGAFSLNPLLLITGIIVDDKLRQFPTVVGDKTFFRNLTTLADTLVRSHHESVMDIEDKPALMSAWKALQNTNVTINKFVKMYQSLSVKYGLNLEITSKYESRDVRGVDFNMTMQWPWPPGECWEFSATHGGAAEGLSDYIPAAIDMAPSLYMDWLQNFEYLGSNGSVHASHQGILTTHSTCNVEIRYGQFSTYYSHIKMLDGLETGDEVGQGDLIGHIELRPD